jgi:glutamate/tyrosine decarboxylase-like PLP-dependent enzyme
MIRPKRMPPMKNRIFSAADPGRIADDIRPLLEFEGEGLSLKELRRLIDKALVPHLADYGLPSFHSYFNAFPEEGAELGAGLALRFNQGVTNWHVSPGGAVLEEECGRALCRLFGFPGTADATFMYCGTYANQQALYMALHRKAERAGFDLAEKGIRGFPEPEKLVVAVSEQAHFSVRHAVRMLGLGEESLLRIPVDRNQRVDAEILSEVLGTTGVKDHVVCAVLTAGTTSTGAVDPIRPIVDAASGSGIWIHVDGAYGLAYALVPEYAPLFDGFAEADSVSWDPHKQLGAPIPNSVLFVKDARDFRRMAIHGEYFNRKDDPHPNPGLKSAPSTRPMSALALAASLRHLGKKGTIDRLRAPLKAVKELADALRGAPDIELCHEPDTGVLCLRLRPAGFPEDRLDDLHLRVYRRIQTEGRRSVSITRLGDRAALRFVAVSPAVTAGAMLETVADARAVAAAYPASP